MVKKKPIKKIIKKIKEPVNKIRKILATKKQHHGPVHSTKKKPIKKKIIKKPAKKIIKKSVKLKKIVEVKKTVKKRKSEAPVAEFSAENLFKAKIKVVGIGGGGGSIVSEIGKSLEKATFVVADTDTRALKKKPGIKDFYFGEELTHGLGTGLNIDLAKKAAESAREKISGIFKDQDIVIFIASLGGGLGSGATQVFAEVAKEFGGITLGIFTLPFKFEGANKYRIAQNALRSLRQSLNVSLVIPNEKIFKVIDTNTAITDAFSMVNKSLVEGLESLIDLIYSPGIINIDFADLRAILKGVGNSAFLNTIEESGKNRADKVCEKILVNPLLQNNNFEVEKILLNISGSSDLPMFEVEKISKRVTELNPRAKIIFGISKDQKLKNKIKTTILMTGGGMVVEEKVIEKPEEKVIEAKKDEEIVLKKEIKPKIYKQPKARKPKIHKKTSKEKKEEKKREEEPVLIPVFQSPASSLAVLEERKLSVVEPVVVHPVKTAIRRSGLEIKKAEEQEEKKRQDQEKEWEIPAFLRKIKYNK